MTPHIEAKKEEIAKIVLMPGDPLRAKFIAETYLEDYVLVNNVRGMYGYTGTYKEKRITVMASGMGMPSMGIYSYELFKFYDVDNIIRIGSMGAYTDKLNLYDLVLVTSSYSESTYAYIQNGYPNNIIDSSKTLNEKIRNVALKNNINLTEGIINSTDVFYSDKTDISHLYNEKHCLGVEMESFALFHNAKILNKEAACILTVSDNLVTGEETTSAERQLSFTKMIELALDSVL